MDRTYALAPALPPELVNEVLEALWRGSPQDVVSYCASNRGAKALSRTRDTLAEAVRRSGPPYLEGIGAWFRSSTSLTRR